MGWEFLGTIPSSRPRSTADLAGSGAKLAAVRRKFPTGALAPLEFAGPWRELGPGTATLADFVTPKQLAKR
jgi:phosphohistidine phosphatase